MGFLNEYDCPQQFKQQHLNFHASFTHIYWKLHAHLGARFLVVLWGTEDQVTCLRLPDQFGHSSNVLKVEWSYSQVRATKLLLISTLVCVNFKSKAKQSKDIVEDSYICHILTLRSHKTNLIGTVGQYKPVQSNLCISVIFYLLE